LFGRRKEERRVLSCRRRRAHGVHQRARRPQKKRKKGGDDRLADPQRRQNAGKIGEPLLVVWCELGEEKKREKGGHYVGSWGCREHSHTLGAGLRGTDQLQGVAFSSDHPSEGGRGPKPSTRCAHSTPDTREKRDVDDL